MREGAALGVDERSVAFAERAGVVGRGAEHERPTERLTRLVRAQVQGQEQGQGRGAERACGRECREAGVPQMPLPLEPRSAHEAITREMVLALQREVTHLRGRLDALFYLMVGSVLLDVVLRLIGRGA